MRKHGWLWAFLMVVLVALLSPSFGCTIGEQTTAPVKQPDQVSISSFTTSASSISAGQSATLSWNVSGANAIRIDPGIGNVNPSDTKQVSPSETTTYTLSAVADRSIDSKVASLKIIVTPVEAAPADLVITEVNLQGAIVYYKIKNVGGTIANQSQTYIYLEDIKASNDFVDTLKPGEERILSFNNYTLPLSQIRTRPSQIVTDPPHINITVKVCADAENAVSESNKTNNCTYILWGAKSTYDFVQNAHLAEWRSNTGRLSWPMVAENKGGAAFVYHRALEDGSIYYTDRCLATYPRDTVDGVIQGTYGKVYAGSAMQQTRLLEMEVPRNAKFTTKLGFAQGAQSSNGVKASFGIIDPTGTTVFLKSADVHYDGKLDDFKVDLSGYAGQKLYFILRTDAKGSAAFDWLVWLDPKITQE
jgi:hypothetical protein